MLNMKNEALFHIGLKGGAIVSITFFEIYLAFMMMCGAACLTLIYSMWRAFKHEEADGK